MSTPAEPTAPATGPGTAPTTPPAATPAVPAAPVVTDEDEGTDWKALARKHEKRAKDSHAELEKIRAASMSEQERAVAEAETRGRKAADATYGTKLAAAEFRAACAAAQIDLGEATEFVDVTKFVGDDGEVNTAAIKSAVTRFSKLAKPSAGRSGADLSGGSGDTTASLDKQIEEATKARDFAGAIRLKRQKAAQQT